MFLWKFYDTDLVIVHFRQMLRNWEVVMLGAWLIEARATSIKELQQFANGLE